MIGNGVAAAAQAFRTIEINGRSILLGKLTFKDFASVREQACAECKRSLIKTYLDNMDLLDESDRATIRQVAFEKAEKVTPDSLPDKKAWLPKRDPQSGRVLHHRGQRFWHPEAKQWVEDGGPLLEEQEIEYSGWWLAQTNAGRMYAAWLSMRKCPGQESWTIDDVAALFGEDEEAIEHTANAVGDLSQQRLGNAGPPQAAQPAGAA